MIKQAELELLKQQFPQGTRVECIQMNDDPHPVPRGTRGTVSHIDSIGTIFVRWDNGSSLGLIYGEDKYRKVSE